MTSTGLANIALSASEPSTENISDSNSVSSYEGSVIAWAASGQRLKSTKLSRENIQARDDLQLIGAQVIFRHGARTPLYVLPNIEQVIYSKEHIDNYLPSKYDVKLITKLGNDIVAKDKILAGDDIDGLGSVELESMSGEKVVTGQLTSVGEKQLFDLGRFLRSDLIDDNNDNNGLISTTYDPKYVYCRSTYMVRTVSSARSFLAGLFSSEKPNNKVQANGPFEIEVRHYPDEDIVPNPNVYPILNKCHDVPTFYTALNDSHELKKARQALINRLGITKMPYGIIELNDEIISRQAHNFSVPEDILELSKDFEIMAAREYVYRSTNIGFELFIRSSCGRLLYLIRENFNSILKNYLEEKNNNNSIEKPYHKLFLYSVHDRTMVPLAIALEIFNMRWSKYASYILIKLFISKNNPNETYVTVDFDGDPQILPNCSDYYCPYSTFLKELQHLFNEPKRQTEKVSE